jgi:hypothetical protein
MSKMESVNKLLDYRSRIEQILNDMNNLLKSDFIDEYSIAYQHWIPQIRTALRDDTRWLSRGQYSMDYTLRKINDQKID